MDRESGIDAAVMAAFLRTGKHVDQASMLLLIIAVVVRPTLTAALALALIAAAIQKYYALRVSLDADLFAILARHPEHSTEWDAALALCARRPATTRPLALRWQGARRLQQRQIAALAVELAILMFLLVQSAV